MADVTTDTKKTCFVISPIGEAGSPERKAADTVLKHLITRALGSAYDVRRGDGDHNPGAITPQIIGSIVEADLIVADLSGANPNVFYELAMAHGYEKPVVHVQQVDDPVAFDVKDMRIIRYDTTDPDALETAVDQLTRYAAFAEENPGKIETPLSAAGRFVSLQASVDPVADGQREIIGLIEDLRLDLASALRRRPEGETDALQDSSLVYDVRMLYDILHRIGDRRGFVPGDLESTINRWTSPRYDKVVKRWAIESLPAMDPVERTDLLYTD
jgi:hypothetical protein